MKLYGIIGYPLAQSASPAFFNKKFQDEGIDARYIPFEIESTDELPRIIEEHPNLCGFNVTIPHKLNVMQHLAGISDEAKAINAVNVVKVTRNGEGKAQLWGYNSDVIGFSRSIEPLLGAGHKKALVLGTGGASKAIVYALDGKTNLTAEDLQIDHPYNTYTNVGLTPGAISNPGLASLKAALNPSSTNYYFYVLNPETGTHKFSATLDEHNAFIATLE